MASSLKADGTLITSCDRWSDATLVDGLQRLYPEDGVLSEEDAASFPAPLLLGGGSLRWHHQFCGRHPLLGDLAGALRAGRPVLAVLDVPPLLSGLWRSGDGGPAQRQAAGATVAAGPQRGAPPSAAARSACSRNFPIAASRKDPPSRCGQPQSRERGHGTVTVAPWRPPPRSGTSRRPGWCCRNSPARCAGWPATRRISSPVAISRPSTIRSWRRQ